MFLSVDRKKELEAQKKKKRHWQHKTVEVKIRVVAVEKEQLWEILEREKITMLNNRLVEQAWGERCQQWLRCHKWRSGRTASDTEEVREEMMHEIARKQYK